MFFKVLNNYGGLISLISLSIIVIGWFVLLNSTKYITSRNEAKSFVNDLTTLLETAFKESIEFWSVFSKKSTEEKNAFYRKNNLTIIQIRDYKDLLKKYDIDILDRNTLKKIKDNLTLSPDIDISSDTERTQSFILKKTSLAHREGSRYILSIHHAFLKKYLPTKKPLIEDIFKLNYVSGFFYGVIIMFIYFTIGSSILG